jgi:hypothetical protein
MKHQLTKYFCTYNWCSTQNNLQKDQSIYIMSKLLGYYYKYTTQGVLCIFIPQLLNFFLKKSWNYQFSFSKANQYLTKCWLLIIGTIFSLSLDQMTCKLYYEYCNPLTNIAQTLNQISLQLLVGILSFSIVICNWFSIACNTCNC